VPFYSRLVRTYFSWAGFVSAGIHISLNDNWLLAVNAGYQLICANDYKDSAWRSFIDRSIYDDLNLGVEGGIILTAAVKARY
jgi:hypothetical protein